MNRSATLFNRFLQIEVNILRITTTYKDLVILLCASRRCSTVNYPATGAGLHTKIPDLKLGIHTLSLFIYPESTSCPLQNQSDYDKNSPGS